MLSCQRCYHEATHVVLSYTLPRQFTAVAADKAPWITREVGYEAEPPTPYFCAACAKARAAEHESARVLPRVSA